MECNLHGMFSCELKHLAECNAPEANILGLCTVTGRRDASPRKQTVRNPREDMKECDWEERQA
jgi:hypothetical protein